MKRRDFLRLMGVAAPAVVATARAIVENQSAEPVRDLEFSISHPRLASLVKSDLGAVYNPVV